MSSEGCAFMSMSSGGMMWSGECWCLDLADTDSVFESCSNWPPTPPPIHSYSGHPSWKKTASNVPRPLDSTCPRISPLIRSSARRIQQGRSTTPCFRQLTCSERRVRVQFWPLSGPTIPEPSRGSGSEYSQVYLESTDLLGLKETHSSHMALWQVFPNDKKQCY